MKKRLLFAFMAMFAAVSGYALEQGEFVYTPQGRFQITGANLNANNAFQDMTGWTVVSAAEKTLTDLFNINANGLAEGFNSVASLDATAGEGMYYQFVPTDASSAYVVSYKLKGATAVSTRVKTVAVSTNLVKVEGNSDNAFGGTNDVLVANTAEELTDGWQTFNYAIVGDGTTRTYFISFTGMATNIEIADLQIAPALQFADLRQRDAMLEKLNVYKNCYDWKAGVLDEYAINEAIETLQAIGDESGQSGLDEALVTAQEILDEFLDKNMDDYLPDGAYKATTNGAGEPKVDMKFNTWFAKVQKAYTWGDWNCLPSGRGFWENADQGAADLGHYQNGAKWNNGDPTSPMGIYMQKSLDAGTYVFSIDSRAALREPKKSDWNNDDGLKPAYGIAYIAKVIEGSDPVIIKSVQKDLDPVDYESFFVVAKIEETGTYEIGYQAYCKETHQEIAQGSVTYIKNAAIWGKNENVYNQKQLAYEADVREQIAAGRTNLKTAAEYLANADYLWGKSELQACVDTVETKIAKYELLDQDDIIATYEDDYVKSTSEETGYLVYTIYQEAVKDIIATNRYFVAVNDTLASIQATIDNAEATMANRLYNAATGKDALQTAISKAKGIQAQMKAAQYSEENAATIVAANAELAEAVEVFKTTVPASAITTIADIDFSQMATETTVEGTEVSQWVIAGAVNEMILPNYTEDGTGTTYGQGLFDNGERILADTLRVGNGSAIVNIPADQQVDGTNILKIDFDYYFGNLVGKYAGFELQNSDSVAIAAFSFSPYDGKASVNTFNLDFSATYMPKVGDRNNFNAAIAAVSNKTHFEVIVDYGTKTMYCSTTAAKGSQTTTPVEFDGSKMAKFIVKSDYNNADRRCWFDNLKIQRFLAGEVTGIQNVKTGVNTADGAIYNLAGQKVSKSFKGLIIKNGKKYFVK